MSDFQAKMHQVWFPLGFSLHYRCNIIVVNLLDW